MGKRNGGWVLRHDFNNKKVRPMRTFFKYKEGKWWLYDRPSEHYPHIAKGIKLE